VERVLQPTVDELRRLGSPFVGLLYAGLALTKRGLRVIEFNARFGDPETQVVLPLLKTPLAQLLHQAATGRLAEAGPLLWHESAAVTVVLAASGYPATPRGGDPITGIERAEAAGAVAGAVTVYQAGTALNPAGDLITSGGRVLAVTARAEDLASARDLAYAALSEIEIRGSHYRTDIAGKAIAGAIDVP
jgi:phosphoribosylamine--glycine ligase